MKEAIPGALAGERVDRVVALLTGLTRSEVASLVTAGGVRLDGTPVGTRSRRVAEGEELEIEALAVAESVTVVPDAEVEVPVLHADDDVVVVDKPAGLVVHPGAGQRAGTMVQGLLARFPELAVVGEPGRPGIVHRLDKGTSGVLVVARSALAYASLVQQLGDRSVERRYLALAWGHVEAETGLVDAPVGRSAGDPTRMTVSTTGRAARTRYQVLERYRRPVPLTKLECRLETGRTHQVRVHLAAIGHALVGDDRYGGGRSTLPCPRPFLHARVLGFDHPATGERMVFESPLPEDLSAVLASLS